MDRAQEQFEDKVNRQSKTLDEAVTEYRKRYDMDPPKGFDEWFQFAKDNKAVMIDEYDQLMRDLSPFRQFAGSEIRERAIQVGYLPSVDLVRVQNGTTRTIDVNKGFDDSEVGARAKGFRVMLEKFQDKLPDMDFPINEKAEGRILVPWEQNLYHNLTADASSKFRAGKGAVYIIYRSTDAEFQTQYLLRRRGYRARTRRQVCSRLAGRRKRLGSLSKDLRPALSSPASLRLAPRSTQGRPTTYRPPRTGWDLYLPLPRFHLCRGHRRQVFLLRPPLGALQSGALFLRLEDDPRSLSDVLSGQGDGVRRYPHPFALLLLVYQAVHIRMGPGAHDHQGGG
jgi:hypothetical protein